MEFIRLGIVYIHLIACCVAVGLVVTSDLQMLRRLIRGTYPATHDSAQLDSLQSTIVNALVALWLTGIAMIWIDASHKGIGYFDNPKLQAKIGIVALLTLNGVLLHRAVMPALKKAGSLLHMALHERRLALFSGAVSAVSWCYAAMLGVGRQLSWKYSLLQLLGAYPVLIALGYLVMGALTNWAASRNSLERRLYA